MDQKKLEKNDSVLEKLSRHKELLAQRQGLKVKSVTEIKQNLVCFADVVDMDYQEVVSSVGQETGKFFWTGEQVSINLIPGMALVAISIAGRRSHT